MRCKTCGTTSSRPSAFDDVNLAIRTFDAAQTPIRSLAAAIEAFIEPETLEGDNAYHCEHCASKQPALKGLRFTMLPPVLCLGLKRFDFDFAELRRVKLHHSVAVPAMLSASTFLEDRAVRQAKRKLAGDNFEADSGEGGSSTEAVSFPKSMELSLESSDGAAGGDIFSGEGGLTEGGAGDDGEPASGEAAGGQAASGKATSAVASGEAAIGEGRSSKSSAADQYELFSLLMHSGSALAGHYFCFIKDLSSGTWYKFDDSTVSLATDSQLQAAMGATENGSAGSTYMVFYRRVDSAEPLVPPVNVPPGLQEASLAAPIEGFGQSSSSSDAMMLGAAESSSTAYTSDAPGSAGTSLTSASSTDPVCGPSFIGPMPQGVVRPETGACCSLATTSTNSGSSSEKGVVIGRRAR